MSNLAEGLPTQIKRAREILDSYKSLRSHPGIIVEPQIAMMERGIDEAVKAAASGDVVDMMRWHEELKGWE